MLGYSPTEVFIEPTNYCNLKCPVCPQHAGLKRSQGFMSLDIFAKVLEQVKKTGTPKVTLHFAGESLLNKDLFEMVSLSKKAGLYTRLHTNATLLSEENSRRMIKSGLDEVSISFDDPRKEVYESIRLNASYEKTLENIRNFLRLKKKLRAHKPYTILQRMVIERKHDSPAIRNDYHKLFRGLPVDRFHTIYTHNWAGDYQGAANASHSEKSPCSALWYRFVVGWDGKVHACCNEMNGRLVIGDLSNDSLAKIWNGAAMTGLRRMMLEGRYDEIEACRGCDALVRCKVKKINPLERIAARILKSICAEFAGS